MLRENDSMFCGNHCEYHRRQPASGVCVQGLVRAVAVRRPPRSDLSSSQQGAPQATGRQHSQHCTLYSFSVQCAGRPGPGGDQGWSRLLFPIYGGNQDQDILRPVPDG